MPAEVFASGFEGIRGFCLSSGFGGGRAASGVDMFVRASMDPGRKVTQGFFSFILQEEDVSVTDMMFKKTTRNVHVVNYSCVRIIR